MDLQSAVDAYIESRTNKSKNTRRAASSTLGQFRLFLADHPAIHDVSLLHVSDARHFAEHLAKTNHVPACIRTYLSHVNSFYHFLLRNQFLSLSSHEIEDLSYFMRNDLPRSDRLPISTSNDLIARLVKAAHALGTTYKKSNKPSDRLTLVRLRDIALLEALRSSGMRVGESVFLKKSDLIEKSHAARVTGKGARKRIVYFDDKAWQALKDYHTVRSKVMEPGLLGSPVFSRHDRQAGTKLLPLSTNAVRVMFSTLAQSAGIKEWIHPHGLRHAFAERVLDKTGNLAIVQDLLGHASPETTRIYAKTTNRQLAEAHRKAFDEKEIESED